VGDEAVLIAGATHCPMAVGADRVAAARALIEHSDCDIILSDDGLQHYAMQRDIEIIVIDGVRRFGTGFLIPAGPLREPARRLQEADLVVINGLGSGQEHRMRMIPGEAHSLLDDSNIRRLSDFHGHAVHAVAGIGNSERFFQLLQQRGMQVQRHAFPDHYQYTSADIRFNDKKPVIMTEKDAVKCRHFATENNWYIPVTVQMSEDFCQRLDALLEDRVAHQQY
jgi:tetraacyldisaccharide 4'-kinase